MLRIRNTESLNTILETATRSGSGPVLNFSPDSEIPKLEPKFPKPDPDTFLFEPWLSHLFSSENGKL